MLVVRAGDTNDSNTILVVYVTIRIAAVGDDIDLVAKRRQTMRLAIRLASDSAEAGLGRIFLGNERYAHEFTADPLDCGANCAW